MKMKFFLLPFSFLLCFTPLEAQDDETQIRKLIQDLVNAVNNMHNMQDAQSLKGFFTPGYTSIRTDYFPDGSTQAQSVDLNSMGIRLGGIATDPDQTVEYVLDGINFLKVLQGTAVTNFNTTFAIKNKGSVVYSGSSNVTYRLAKTDSGWKVASAHTAEVRDNVERYVCNYEVYKKDNSAALLKVTYPAGTTFQTEYLNVDIQNIQSTRNLVKTDRGDQFNWVNGKIELPNPSTGMTQSLTAANEIGVYNQLVVHYHPKHCAGAAKSN